MLGAQQTVPWDLQLSLNLFANSKSYSLQGWESGFSGIMMGVTKTFLDDRLSLSLMGITGFDKRGNVLMETYSKGQAYEATSVIHIPIRQALFSVSWTFGKSGISVKQAKRNEDSDDVLNSRSMDSIPSVGSSM